MKFFIKWNAKEQFFSSYKSIQPVNKCELLPYCGHLCRFICTLGLVLKPEKIPTMAPDDFTCLTLSAGKWPDCNKYQITELGALYRPCEGPFPLLEGSFHLFCRVRFKKVEEINYTFVLGLSSSSLLYQLYFLRRTCLKQSSVWVSILPATGL